jgi:hypothetical protein
MMNPEIRDQWADALESDEYAQCQNALTRVAPDGVVSHCCLGVLTELGVKAGVITRNEADDDGRGLIGYGPHNEKATLPDAIQKWAGITGPDSDNPMVDYKSDRHSLAELNDYLDVKFPEIAKVVRQL